MSHIIYQSFSQIDSPRLLPLYFRTLVLKSNLTTCQTINQNTQ